MRVFIAARLEQTVAAVTKVFKEISLKHFSGIYIFLRALFILN